MAHTRHDVRIAAQRTIEVVEIPGDLEPPLADHSWKTRRLVRVNVVSLGSRFSIVLNFHSLPTFHSASIIEILSGDCGSHIVTTSFRSMADDSPFLTMDTTASMVDGTVSVVRGNGQQRYLAYADISNIVKFLQRDIITQKVHWVELKLPYELRWDKSRVTVDAVDANYGVLYVKNDRGMFLIRY